MHLLSWPYALVHPEGQAYVDQVAFAQFLHDGSELLGPNEWLQNQLKLDGEAVKSLQIPQTEPEAVTIPVIELFWK